MGGPGYTSTDSQALLDVVNDLQRLMASRAVPSHSRLVAAIAASRRAVLRGLRDLRGEMPEAVRGSDAAA
jgi:hypothetical protein